MGLRVPTQPRKLSKPSSCLSHVTNIPLQTDEVNVTRATFSEGFAATCSGQVPAVSHGGKTDKNASSLRNESSYERVKALPGTDLAHALGVLLQGILLLCQRVKRYTKGTPGGLQKIIRSCTSTWTEKYLRAAGVTATTAVYT